MPRGIDDVIRPWGEWSGEKGVERREWRELERVGKSWRKKREKKCFGSALGFPTVLHSSLSSLFH